MALKSGARIGRYEVIHLLGAGGMGEVYRARDTRVGRDVAVKVLPSDVSRDRDRLHRFEQEARAAGALNHPNILTVHDFGTESDTVFLVTELLEGQSLRDVVAAPAGKGAGLPVRQALDIARQIASGLAAAHEHGIVHRDLKPENVFVLNDGRVKLLDFGLAKLRPTSDIGVGTDVSTQGAPTGTSPGMVLGTVGYMAPEQVRGQAVDHRADVFACGAVLYELLSGRRAFGGATPADTLSAILSAEPADLDVALTSAHPSIDRIVRRCLQKAPERRFQSASDLSFALDALAERPSAPGVAAMPPPPPRRSTPVRAAVPWLVAFAGIVAAAYAWLPLEGQAPTPRPVHAFINAPDEVTHAFYRGFALSPDGEYLAFPARDREGRVLLWIRTMSTGDAAPIQGSNEAAFPFWSPNGREVAFWSDRSIKRVSPLGGVPPQVVCESGGHYSTFRGGAWLADDTIVYASNSGPVMACRRNGSPEPAIEPVEGVNRYLWPRALAAGSTFLLGVEHDDQQRQGIYRAQVGQPLPDTPLVRGLTQSALGAGFAPPNHMIWRAGGAGAPLVTQRLDREAMDPALEVVIAPRTSGALGGASFDATASGRLIYLPFIDSAGPSINSTGGTYWFSRAGVRGPELRVATQSAYRLAPDGIRVSMLQDNGDIFIADLDRGVRTRVTTTPEFEQSVMWSADGRRIAFRRVGLSSDLFVHDFTTGRTERLSGAPSGAFIGSDWSSDGRTIIASVLSGERQPSLDLVTFDLQTKRSIPLAITPFNESQPRFSLDGAMVAYASDETGNREVHVRQMTSGVSQRISRAGGGFPMWRADGREIVFVAPDGTFTAVAVDAGDELRFGEPVKLFTTTPAQDAGDFYKFDMTRDGQRFLIQLSRDRPQPLVLFENWTALLQKARP